MRTAALSAMVLMGLAGQSAVAAETPCTAIVALRGEELADCTCGRALAPMPMSAPPGMTLITACGSKYEHDAWDGGFYFRGSHVTRGLVTRENNAMHGDLLSFTSTQSGPYRQFASAAGHLKFWDDPVAMRRFHAPRPTEKTPCWAASAKIDVQILHVLAGGSDQSGSYPRKYRVLSVGKYRPCA